MKQVKKPFIFLLLILCLGSCNKPNSNFVELGTDNGNEEEVDKPRTTDDVIADFQALNFRVGVNDFSLESPTEGLFWNFRVIVPADASATNKKPLLFSLHGGAQNTSSESHKTTDCLISPGLDGIIDAYIISPNSNGKLWYNKNNQIQLLALYDLMTSNLPIDMNKIAITGYSDGGNGSWFYSQYYSNMFSAAIPMASSYNTKKNDGSVEAITIPLYVIHGNEDSLFPVATTQAFVNASIDAGSDIEFVIAPNLDHYQPCDYVPYLRDAAQWLVNTVWN